MTKPATPPPSRGSLELELQLARLADFLHDEADSLPDDTPELRRLKADFHNVANTLGGQFAKHR